MDRKHLERILMINGVSPTAPDEEIRTLLMSAHYREDEVETALMVLREQRDTKVQRLEGVHTLIQTDKNLSAKEVSSLLGIDITVPSKDRQAARKPVRMTGRDAVVIIVLAVLIAGLALGLSMYVLDFGLFHPVGAYGSPTN
jgi:hypothetical protein